MTIASEIQRIKNNIASAYTACVNKGATLPNKQDSANLANCINNIEVGSNIETEEITITPTKNVQVKTPTKDGFSKVTVNAVNSSIDSNITASNIKNGVSILGVTGNLTELKGQTKTVTSNGTVTPDNGYNALISVTVNVPTNESSSVSGEGIPREVVNGVYRKKQENFNFALPNNATDIAKNALYMAFYEENSSSTNAYLTALDISSLTNVSGDSAFYRAFYYNSRLKTVNAHNLINVSAKNAFYQAFENCGSLNNIDFSSLKEVTGEGAFYYAFEQASIASVDFSSLETVSGTNAFNQTFRFCRSLRSANFDSLKYVTGSKAFYWTFDVCPLQELYFPSLARDAFGSGGYTDQLSGIVYAVNNCTIHFPCYLKNTLIATGDAMAGFGGYGTTILFDLHCAVLNFTNVTSSMNIYVDGNLVENNTCETSPEDENYYLLENTTNNNLYLIPINNLQPDEVRNISVSQSGAINKITLSTGVSGLNAYFYIKGNEIKATEEGTGNYYINLCSDTNVEIDYKIDGGYNYADYSGTITTTGNNITENIALTTATLVTFSQPYNQSSNGTLGGSSFACTASSDVSDAYYAFKSSSYWGPSNYEGEYLIFYNPKPLNVTALKIDYWSSTYSAARVTVEASNDYINWEQIHLYVGSKEYSQTLNITNQKFYKYFKLTFNETSSRAVEVEYVKITATYKQ